VDPDSIDAVVISQDNPDNSRGLDGLLKERTEPVDIYALPGMYAGKGGLFSGSVGIPDACRGMASLHFDEGWIEPIPGVFRSPYFDVSGGYREANIVLDEAKRLTVISGFGAAGPEVPITEAESHFGGKVRTFIGSVNLTKKKKAVAEGYAASFQSHGVQELRLNHSTSREGMTNLRVVLGLAEVKDFYVGCEYSERSG
jgi:7,8-dihydropterin-6-yl-methyl-4-(beta-D-ribofuranosyl)aminobenzene 5'-phosphate synthase